jgi:hypothetical protein
MESLPTDRQDLIRRVQQIIHDCEASQGRRANLYRSINLACETGRMDGSQAIFNLLYAHIDRLASHLYSPVELRFAITFDEDYGPGMNAKAKRAAKLLTMDWQRSNTDLMFGQGVFDSLKYGSVILKQWPTIGPNGRVRHNAKLVKPWHFGVYNERIQDLTDEQPAMVETIAMTMPEVWARIRRMPNARALYQKIDGNAGQRQATEVDLGFYHQVIPTAQIQFSNQQIPGGIVSVTSPANQALYGATVTAKTVIMKEVWVWDRDDWAAIQFIEPDILIEPQVKLRNILFSDREDGPRRRTLRVVGGNDPDEDDGTDARHPYTKIQVNQADDFWGRSELADLVLPQDYLATTAEDGRRLMGLTIDKLLGFVGWEGDIAEVYGDMRRAGYVAIPDANAKIQDLTPQFPAELRPMMETIIQNMERIGGFDNLLSGRGEPGVRAGNQASTMLRAASPRLRDRSLLVERQCASAADLWLSIREAKDGRVYWADGSTEQARTASQFYLGDLPDDRFVTVDSHSSSPIFADDHAAQAAFALKAGVIGPEDWLEDSTLPNKDVKLERLRGREQAQQKRLEELMHRDPEAAEKLMAGGRKR